MNERKIIIPNDFKSAPTREELDAQVIATAKALRELKLKGEGPKQNVERKGPLLTPKPRRSKGRRDASRKRRSARSGRGGR